MELSEYADKEGITYKQAHRRYKAGKIEGAEMRNGKIVVPDPKPQKSVSVVTDALETRSLTSYHDLAKSLHTLITGEEPTDEKTIFPDTAPAPKKAKVYYQTDIATLTGAQAQDFYDRDYKRLTDKDLMDLARMDPHVSAILTTRLAQISSFGDKSDSQFDKGLRIADPKPPKEDDYKTKEEYDAACSAREKFKNDIFNWMMACGTEDQALLDQLYEERDPTFKYCDLRSYIQAQARNVLTLGRYARYNLRDENGQIVTFRPTPVETIKLVRPGHTVWIGHTPQHTNSDSVEDAKEYNELPQEKRRAVFLQVIDNQPIAFFDEKEIHIEHYQKQAQMDLKGYPMGPIEFALFLIWMHQHSLQYMRNQLTKGLLARGVIVVSTKDPETDIGQDTLTALKRDLTNLATGAKNSNHVPIIGGSIDLKVVPLDLTANDIQFVQLEQMIIRSLCAAFQIAPAEVGFGLLGDSGAGLSGANSKDMELVQGEERGLRILLDIILHDLNDVMWDKFPQAKEMGLKLIAVGIGSETREAMIARLAQEQQLTATQNDLLSQSEKNVQIRHGGDIPLSPLFHQSCVQYMFYDEFRAEFMGDEEALGKPELHFLINPALEQMRQGLMQQQAQQQQPQVQQKPSMADVYNSKQPLQKSWLDAWLQAGKTEE